MIQTNCIVLFTTKCLLWHFLSEIKNIKTIETKQQHMADLWIKAFDIWSKDILVVSMRNFFGTFISIKEPALSVQEWKYKRLIIV